MSEREGTGGGRDGRERVTRGFKSEKFEKSLHKVREDAEQLCGGRTTLHGKDPTTPPVLGRELEPDWLKRSQKRNSAEYEHVRRDLQMERRVSVFFDPPLDVHVCEESGGSYARGKYDDSVVEDIVAAMRSRLRELGYEVAVSVGQEVGDTEKTLRIHT